MWARQVFNRISSGLETLTNLVATAATITTATITTLTAPTTTVATSLTVGTGGTAIALIKSIAATIDPVSVAANTTAEQTVTVTGVAVGDLIIGVDKPTATAGVGVVGARVSATDTVALTYVNSTGSGVDPAEEEYTFTILRPV